MSISFPKEGNAAALFRPALSWCHLYTLIGPLHLCCAGISSWDFSMVYNRELLLRITNKLKQPTNEHQNDLYFSLKVFNVFRGRTMILRQMLRQNKKICWHTIWPNVCAHQTLTSICWSSWNSGHKVGFGGSWRQVWRGRILDLPQDLTTSLNSGWNETLTAGCGAG